MAYRSCMRWWVGWGQLAVLWMGAALLGAVPGTVDPAFNATGTSGGQVLTGLPDGRVLVSGTGLLVGAPVSNFRVIARFKSDGSVDPDFSAASLALGSVSGHILRSDGRLLVYGNITTAGTHPTRGAALLKDDGAVDTAFAINVAWTDPAHLAMAEPDGFCLVGYRGGQLIRVDPNGIVDPGFAPNPPLKAQTFGAVRQPSGKVVILQSGKVFRLLSNGALDPSYTETAFPGLGLEYGRYSAAPDGSLFVSSNTSQINGGELRTIVRLLPEGGVDPAFKFAQDGTSAGSRTPTFLGQDSLGRLYLQGSGFAASQLQRFLPAGLLDPSFANFGIASAFGFDANGLILLTGTYIQVTPVVVVKTGLMRLFNDDVPPGPSKPSIYAPPVATTADSGAAAKLSVGASGDGPLSYVWYQGEIPVLNATTAKLAFDPVRLVNAGSYTVVVSNSQGSVTSAPVMLTVRTEPRILQEPVGFTSQEGVSSNLITAVLGEPPLSFQWYQGEQPVTSGTNSFLEFPSLLASDSGLYRMLVSNAWGAATSAPVRIHVLASKPEWLVVTNVTSVATANDPANPFRPDAAIRVASDGARGVVVLYEKGLERWSDAGQRLWSIRYDEADAGKLGAVALDRDGNAYVSGLLHFVGALGDLSMTNNSTVPGPNGHVQAFIAKIDPDGHGLWYRLYEAAGPRIGGLAVDTDGGVVFAGGSGGRFGQARLGGLAISESEYAGAVAGKLGPDGTPKWFRGFAQFAVNRSTCEADSVAVDDTGIYLSGLISFSIQFGSFQLQNSGPNSVNWLGKLDTNGEPKWIRSAGGQPWQGAPLVAAGGRRWFLLPRERVLQSWSADGALLTSVNAVASSQNDSAFVNQLGVTGNGEPMLIGNSAGRINVAGVEINPGVTRPLVWFGQWDADGKAIRGRLIATTTNANPNIGGDTVAANAFTSTSAGDAIVAGSFAYSMRFLGRDHVAPPGSVRFDGRPAGAYLAKIGQPSKTPEIIQQPVAAYTLDTGGGVKIGITAVGPGVLSYQWRRDGVPVDGATTNTFEFINARVSDSGRYDVVVSNEFGSAVSDVSVITVRPPFTIRTQPSPQLVLLGGAVLAGAEIDSLAIQSGAIAGKTLAFTVTNSSSARFPVGGQFSLTFKGGTYSLLPGGMLAARNDSYSTVFSLPDLTNLRLQRLNGTDLATLGLLTDGRFDLHYDIAAPDGCCATGTFSVSGGQSQASFQVTTTFFVPAGNYQWQKNGQDLPGQTSATLTLSKVTSADAGFYRCVITYSGYSETSQPAELRVVDDGGNPGAPVLSFEPFQPGAAGISIPAWPAGYVLQRTDSLSPPVWTTYALTGPVTIPFSSPGEFFRLALAE